MGPHDEPAVRHLGRLGKTRRAGGKNSQRPIGERHVTPFVGRERRAAPLRDSRINSPPVGRLLAGSPQFDSVVEASDRFDARVRMLGVGDKAPRLCNLERVGERGRAQIRAEKRNDRTDLA